MIKLRNAIGLTAFANLVVFAFNFLNVVIVSRLLTPEEIGIFSIAVAAIGISHVFREFGVGQYIVQTPELTPQRFRAACTVTLLFSWSIAAVLFIIRYPLATFYQHEGIAEVMALLALNFLLLPFGTPLIALLQRELEFRKLAAFKIINAFCAISVTIFAAWAGASYLSMAWGAVAGHLCNILILNRFRPGRVFLWPTRHGLRDVFRFGSFASALSLLHEVGSSLPDLILGRTLGFSAVAFFSRANGLQKMLLDQVNSMVRNVYFPTFSQQIRAGSPAAELYAHTSVYVVAIVSPVMALAALLAEPLILFLFGTQWQNAAPMATLLCIYAACSTPYLLCHPSLTASGKIHSLAPAQIIIEIVRALSLVSSLWLPLFSVVVLYSAVTLSAMILNQWLLWRFYRLSFWVLLRHLRDALLTVPAALLLPSLLYLQFHNSLNSNSARLLFLAASGLGALAGWTTIIYALKHPLHHEISAIVNPLKTLLLHGCQRIKR